MAVLVLALLKRARNVFVRMCMTALAGGVSGCFGLVIEFVVALRRDLSQKAATLRQKTRPFAKANTSLQKSRPLAKSSDPSPKAATLRQKTRPFAKADTSLQKSRPFAKSRDPSLLFAFFPRFFPVFPRSWCGQGAVRYKKVLEKSWKQGWEKMGRLFFYVPEFFLFFGTKGVLYDTKKFLWYHISLV